MKHAIRLAAILLLAAFVVRAEEAPDDRYIAIYDLIQQADAAAEQGSPADARDKYTTAKKQLEKFAVDFPTWNNKIVKFRLNYLDNKLGAAAARAEVLNAAAKNSAANAEPSQGDLEQQLAQMQSQLRTALMEKAALEQKLAAAPNAKALEDAQAEVKSLQQENKTLKSEKKSKISSVDTATLERINQNLTSAKDKLSEQSQAITSLTTERDLLQKRIDNLGAGDATKEQLAAVQAELAKVNADKAALAAQLKAAQLNSADAAKLAKTEQQVKDLQRENSLLRAAVEKGQGNLQFTNTSAITGLQRSLAELNSKLDEQIALVARLNGEKAELQKQVDLLSATSATTRELAQTKKSFAALKRKFDIQTEAAIILISEANIKVARLSKSNTKLTEQNTSLQKQLNSLASNAKFVVEGLKSENESLRKAAKDAKPTAPVGDFAKLEEQLATLRAKVTVLEAQPIPFTTEELALFRKPEAGNLAKDSGDKKSKKLPGAANDLIAQAQRFFADRKFTEARAKYLEVLKYDDKNVFTLGNLATIELEMDMQDQAEAHLQQALAVKPKDAFCLGALGNLRFRQGKYDAALDALSSAAQLNPNDPEIQNFLGVTLSQKGQRAAAETALRKAIQLDPQYGSAHNNLAVIYMTQNPPQIELARWHYQKALAAGQPHNAELERMIEEASKAAEPKP